MKKITSRKVHRLLSVVIGVQLLLWTVSGLIFSWSPIKTVRGEDRIAEQTQVNLANFNLMPIKPILSDCDLISSDVIVENIVVRQLLKQPVYEIKVRKTKNTSFILCNAITGEKLSPITRETAEQIAMNDFNEPVNIKRSTLLEEVQGSHSEYRKKELPAWKIELDHSSGTTIYVSAARGVVVTRRNNRWRLFDFFWMLHTMDYQGRDNFNSWLLQAMSVFGVTSVLTGYWLWYRSRRKKRKSQNKK